MDLFQEIEKIYSIKSREYFKEVVSSYAIGNFRSAIVMLYSVCMCDLIYKLQELRDVYDDKVAKNILETIEKEQTESNSKSSWEKTLVDSVYKKTNLLDNDGYAYLNHVYDIRNLSAHPALDKNGELISPPKEVVAAYIRTSLDKILLKPAIFSKDIIHFISEDLADKKELMIEDSKFFNRYIRKKYLDKMTDTIFQKTFRVFWRFTFNSVNSDCAKNRSVNYMLLNTMIGDRPEVINQEIKTNHEKYEIGQSLPEIGYSVVFLAFHPSVYKKLPEYTQLHLRKSCEEIPKYKLLSTFLSTNKKSHLENLRENYLYIETDDALALRYMFRLYEEDGLSDECINYFIDVVEDAPSYKAAGNRLELYVTPYLHRMKVFHYERIFGLFDSNSQIRNNIYKGTYAQTIWSRIRDKFPQDYDKTRYPTFFEKISDAIYDL